MTIFYCGKGDEPPPWLRQYFLEGRRGTWLWHFTQTCITRKWQFSRCALLLNVLCTRVLVDVGTSIVTSRGPKILSIEMCKLSFEINISLKLWLVLSPDVLLYLCTWCTASACSGLSAAPGTWPAPRPRASCPPRGTWSSRRFETEREIC